MLSFFAISFILYSSATIECSLGGYLNCSSDDEKNHVLIINNTSWKTCINGNEELANCIIKVYENENIKYISADVLGNAYNDTNPRIYDSWQSAPQVERETFCSRAHLTKRWYQNFQNIHDYANICNIRTIGNGDVFAINSSFNWHECKYGDLVHTKCILPNFYSYPTCIPKTVATTMLQLLSGSPNAIDLCSRVVELLTNHPAYMYAVHTLKNCFNNNNGYAFFNAFSSRIMMLDYEFYRTSFNKRSTDSKELENEKSLEQLSSEDSQDQVDYSSLEPWQYLDGNYEGPRRRFQYPGRHTVEPDSTEFYESKTQSKSESNENSYVNLLKPGSYSYQYSPFGHFNHRQHQRNKFSGNSHIKPQLHNSGQTLVDDYSKESSLEEDVVESDSAEDLIVKHRSRQPATSNRHVLSRPTRFAPKAKSKPVPQHHTYVNHHQSVDDRNRDSFDESESIEIESEADSSAEEKSTHPLLKVNRQVKNLLAQQHPSFPEAAYGNLKSQSGKADRAESTDGALSDPDSAAHGSYDIPTSAELDQYSSLFRSFSQLFDGIRPFLEISARNLRGSAVPSIPQEQNDTGTRSGQSVKRKLVRRKLIHKPIRKDLQAPTINPMDEDLLNSGENQHAGHAQPWLWWPKSAIDVRQAEIEAPSVEAIDKNHYGTTGIPIIGNNVENSDVGIKKESYSSIIPQFPSFSPGTPQPGNYYGNNHVTGSPVDQSVKTTWHAENVAGNKEEHVKESTSIQSPEPQVSMKIPQATGIPGIKNADEHYQGIGSPEVVISVMHANNKIKEHGGEEVVHIQDNHDALPTTEPPVPDGTDANLPL